MENLISKKDKIFIAGHNGMVAVLLLDRKKAGYFLDKEEGKLLIENRSNLDLTDSKSVENYFLKNKPNVVIWRQLKLVESMQMTNIHLISYRLI